MSSTSELLGGGCATPVKNVFRSRSVVAARKKKSGAGLAVNAASTTRLASGARRPVSAHIEALRPVARLDPASDAFWKDWIIEPNIIACTFERTPFGADERLRSGQSLTADMLRDAFAFARKRFRGGNYQVCGTADTFSGSTTPCCRSARVGAARDDSRDRGPRTTRMLSVRRPSACLRQPVRPIQEERST